MLDLQVAITEAKEKFIKEEARNSQRERELFADNQEFRRQHRELQELASEHMQKWRISEEQRVQISDSYHQLQVEGIVNRERQWDTWRKEVDETIV